MREPSTERPFGLCIRFHGLPRETHSSDVSRRSSYRILNLQLLCRAAAGSSAEKRPSGRKQRGNVGTRRERRGTTREQWMTSLGKITMNAGYPETADRQP
jgi:hypothetical protein